MRLLKLFFISFTLIFSQSVFANSSVDARTEYETWNTGINGKTSAILLGLGGTHSINQSWTIAGGFVTGKHDSNDSSQDTLKRSDVDVAVGYRLMPKVTVFAGYRLVKIDYDNTLSPNRSFTDLTHGFGAGISAYHSILPDITAYGRFGLSGLLSTLDSENKDSDRGVGISSGIEAGLIYQFIEHTNIGLAIKQQSSTIDYRGDSEKWNHNYIRIGLSLSHYF